MGPEEFYTRKKELIDLNLWSSDTICVQIAYGNDWEEIIKPKVFRHGYDLDNRWTMYCNTPNDPGMADKIFEKITFKIYPRVRRLSTIHNRHTTVVIDKAPWKFTRTVWGYFDIDIDVKFKPWTKLNNISLRHELAFTRNGKHEKCKVFVQQEAFDEYNAKKLGFSQGEQGKPEKKFMTYNQRKQLKKNVSFKRWR